jgi:hypothetical protein
MKRSSSQLLITTVLIFVLNNCESPSLLQPDNSAEIQDVILQEGNSLPKSHLVAKTSGEFADNRIGAITSGFEPHDGLYGGFEHFSELGFKRLEFTFQEPEEPVDYSLDEFFIPPSFDENLNSYLLQKGIIPSYMLNFWDKANHPNGWQGISSRFKTEEEILRYLDYVRFIVRHFKDRIQYYKIWNEPDHYGIPENTILPDDMINLIRRTVPVIREEYPQAKIVVGTNVIFHTEDYLFKLLNSDIMPLVDVIDWQNWGLGESEEGELEFYRAYYSNYPSLVKKFKDAASAHGFSGEYWASELWWPNHPNNYKLLYPEREYIMVKNTTRSIVNQRRLGITVRAMGSEFEPTIVYPALTNFFTIMAGAETETLTASIEGAAADTADIKWYGFTFQNDEQAIILWREVEPQPLANVSGVPVTITLTDLAGHQATGIDVLHHFRQQLVTSDMAEDLVIKGLLVKDYPIIIQF